LKTGKTCFIHFRNENQLAADAGGKLESKGGATVAWRFDTNGDILVGAPAVCSPDDVYIKSVGRQVAEWQLNNPTDKKPLAFVIPKAEYLEMLTAGAETFNRMVDLTPVARARLINEALGMIADDPLSFVNSSWFETRVRERLAFHEGRVHTFNGKVFGPAR
jgi:hypothetical protein